MTPDPHAERALVDAVLAGAPGAFERLVREYQGLCWHCVYPIVRHADDARDVCQETFLRVFRHLGQYRFESPLKFWIARIAHSIALRHAQRERRIGGDARQPPLRDDARDDADAVREDDTETFDFEAACDDQAAASRLHLAIARLAPIQRSLLTLYHLEELSIPDIAAITALPTGTIKSHLYRARLRLRELLEPLSGAVR